MKSTGTSPHFRLASPRALCLAGWLSSALLMACSPGGPSEPPPPPPQELQVPCAELKTGLEGGEVPATLSATGLYEDMASRRLAPGVREFSPTWPLWSDTAAKRRFVQLPEGCAIENSDNDHWVLPVGARLWKEFVIDGTLMETRFIARYGPGPKDFILAAYAWREDGSDADYVPYGVLNARGRPHDIPSAKTCKSCHSYLPEQALGFSALQLHHDGPGVTLATLAAENRFTQSLPAALQAPGNALESAALGYLHSNCGNCHNPQGIEFNNVFDLRLLVHQTTVAETGAYRTSVNVPVEKFVTPDCNLRIHPGQPKSSCVYHRMTLRGRVEQMPPTGSRIPHPDGLETVAAWIQSLR